MRAGFVEHARHEAREQESPSQPEGDTAQSENESVADDQPEDVVALGAEGKANGHFLAALDHGPREHRGEADGGERRAVMEKTASSTIVKRG